MSHLHLFRLPLQLPSPYYPSSEPWKPAREAVGGAVTVDRRFQDGWQNTWRSLTMHNQFSASCTVLMMRDHQREGHSCCQCVCSQRAQPSLLLFHCSELTQASSPIFVVITPLCDLSTVPILRHPATSDNLSKVGWGTALRRLIRAAPFVNAMLISCSRRCHSAQVRWLCPKSLTGTDAKGRYDRSMNARARKTKHTFRSVFF